MESWIKIHFFGDAGLPDPEKALSSPELAYVRKFLPLIHRLEVEWNQQLGESDGMHSDAFCHLIRLTIEQVILPHLAGTWMRLLRILKTMKLLGGEHDMSLDQENSWCARVDS
jgi:hypothetical protein